MSTVMAYLYFEKLSFAATSNLSLPSWWSATMKQEHGEVELNSFVSEGFTNVAKSRKISIMLY